MDKLRPAWWSMAANKFDIFISEGIPTISLEAQNTAKETQAAATFYEETSDQEDVDHM